ncbi:hypothetical protein ACFDR9_002259 [Janthinobacterium sp. CG_23.3]|uniref:DUF4124 domain-containing protein n=1 Tax=Janthinobacterium sp. CG_23.3 TaxID=3349634 RepID=UPI0038D3EA50
MHHRQRGAINLYWVAILSAAFAAVALAALFSMRAERNLFADGWHKLVKSAGAEAVVQSSQQALGAPAAGVLRKCVINGNTVLSDVDCAANHPGSEVVVVHRTKGIESPKAPAAAAPDTAPATMQDKMIEKATR